MRYMCVYLAAWSLVSACVAAPLGRVRGEVLCEGCGILSDLSMDVQEISSHLNGVRVPLSPGGEFELNGLDSGTYLVNIVDSRGMVVHRETITLAPFTTQFSIRLPRPKIEKPVEGTISVARLIHKAVLKAQKEYRKAEDLFKHNDLSGSIEHLEKAIEADPEFVEAYNNLGSRLMSSKRPEEAILQFRKAYELDPHASLIRTNLSLALLAAQQYTEAAELARASAAEDPADSKAHLALGLALFNQSVLTDEAREHLQGVVDLYPIARLALANMYLRKGLLRDTREQLTRYLERPNPEKREIAERMLAQLP